MRADMFKVIVERPRWGAGHARSAKLKGKASQGIKQIGLKRHAKIAAPYTKTLNENLAPLVRFLRSRRGKHWDTVFSEICAGLDAGSTVKMHVRQHLEDYVLMRTGRDVLARDGIAPVAGALLDAAAFAATGLTRLRSPAGQTTDDIEWNGEPIA